MSSEIDVVAFDLDDTLYEHRQYVTAGFEEVAADVRDRTGVDIYDDLVTAYFEDAEYNRTFDVVLESNGLSTDIVESLVDTYHGHVETLSAYDDVNPTLTNMTESYVLALVTDGKYATKKLGSMGLQHYFDCIVATAGEDFSKQEAKPFRMLLKSIKAEPTRVVYIGDDPRVDFYHPNKLGIHTVRVRRGTVADMDPPDEEFEPDVTVDCIEDLPRVIRHF